jgi:hypothetical protein
VGGAPIAASLFDFGLAIFHLACGMQPRPARALFSLSKLESHDEARIWAEVFRFTEKYLNVPHGLIRVIVAIDTISAASEMDEILSELRDYAIALECSPLNYVSSFIRSFRVHGGYVLPQRSDITINQPFLQAYRDLLVHTCRKHGVSAIGGCLDKPCSQYETNGEWPPYTTLDLETRSSWGSTESASPNQNSSQMFGSVVLEIPKQAFDRAMEDARELQKPTADFDEAALKKIIIAFQKVIEQISGNPFPMDPRAQLRQAVEAVFQSWNNERARHYRRIHGTPENSGTAVTVQAMVFGNYGLNGGTGVGFFAQPVDWRKEDVC